MKERISITVDIEILNVIDKEMLKHQQNSRSKFIEFTLRQVFFNNVKKYKLLQAQRDLMLRKFRVLNDELLILEKHIELEQQSELNTEKIEG